nr:hypothetical protein Iba_scaffold1393CG0490 [Ipomoea batatas]
MESIVVAGEGDRRRETQKRWSQRMRSKEGGGGRPVRSKDIGRGRARKKWSRRMRSEEVEADNAVRGIGSGAGG